MATTSTPAAAPDAETFHVRRWSVEEFAASQALWDELLTRSDADPLFMSWQWQWQWWGHHARVLEATLHVIGIYTAAGRLVGLAPFYSHRVRVRKLLRSTRLELIGVAWRDSRAAFSDYPDIIAAEGFRGAVLRAIEEWLAAERFWDELALCCVKRTGAAAQLAAQRLRRWTLVREVDALTGWCAALPASFEQYLSGLSPDIRRRLFNQRRKIPDLRMEYVPEGEVGDALERLSRLSSARWGGALPADHVGQFHRDMAAQFARTGELRLSRLIGMGETLSVLYCVQRQGAVYFLQSGFDAARSRGLSPGLLHFGYAIESACREGAQRFDFLAGRGRRRDYKRDLLADEVPVVTCQVVRGALQRALYGAYEYVQGYRSNSHAA